MEPKRTLIPAILAAVALTAIPAAAENSQRQVGGRQLSAQSTRADRQAAGGPRAMPRAGVGRPAPSPAVGAGGGPGRSGVPSRRPDPRAERALPRPGPRYDSERNDRVYRPGYYPHRNGSIVVAPYRPYAFRPRLRIGIGLWLGYPVAYPYSYPYVYGGYGHAVIRPGAAYGGVLLAINPPTAAVYVDGSYCGPVESFSDAATPLTLTVGRHRIEVQAPGYRPMMFDVNVAPGQLLPYQGDLAPYGAPAY
jgi:hypothetical protein